MGSEMCIRDRCNEAQKKNKEFQEKSKKIQNHEGSCNLGKTFSNSKKLLISSIEEKYKLCALLESGIGGLILLRALTVAEFRYF